MERDDRVTRDAIWRELERGGQVFYVHNRIESIYHIAEHVQRLAPQAAITVGHGQMEERELERDHARLLLRPSARSWSAPRSLKTGWTSRTPTP